MNCSSCKEPFNLTKRKPYLLSKCGHSICSQCYNQTHGKNIKCNTCSSFTNKDKINENDSLIDALANIAKIKCEKHHKNLEAYCLNDKILLCISCILESQHKSHQLLSLDKAAKEEKETFIKNYEQIAKKDKIIENIMKEIENKIKFVKDNYNEELQKSKSFFKEAMKIIQEREEINEDNICKLRTQELETLNVHKENFTKYKNDLSTIKKHKINLDTNSLNDIQILQNSNNNERIFTTITSLKEDDIYYQLSLYDTVKYSDLLNRTEELNIIVKYINGLQKKYEKNPILVIKKKSISELANFCLKGIKETENEIDIKEKEEQREENDNIQRENIKDKDKVKDNDIDNDNDKDKEGISVENLNIDKENETKTKSMISTFNFVNDTNRSSQRSKVHPQLFPTFKTPSSTSTSNLLSLNDLNEIKQNDTLRTLSLNLSINSNPSQHSSKLDSNSNGISIHSPLRIPGPLNNSYLFNRVSKAPMNSKGKSFSQSANNLTMNRNYHNRSIRDANNITNIQRIHINIEENKESKDSKWNTNNYNYHTNNIEETSSSQISLYSLDMMEDKELSSLYKEVNSCIYIIGGKSDTVSRKFSLDTNKFDCLNCRNIERSEFAVVQYKDSKFLIIGGKVNKNGNENLSDSIELFNAENLSINKLEFRLKTPKSSFGGGYILGKLFICGGFDGRFVLDTFEFYDQRIKKWLELPRMFHKRRDFCFVQSPDNVMYVIGGQDEKENVLKSVEKFDVMKNTWVKLKDMNQKRKGASAVCMPDGIYVIGGNDGAQYLKSMEKFDFAAKKWSYLGDMKYPKSCFSASPSGDFRYIITFGGYNGRPMSIVEKYDVIKEKWEVIKELPSARYKHNSLFMKE